MNKTYEDTHLLMSVFLLALLLFTWAVYGIFTLESIVVLLILTWIVLLGRTYRIERKVVEMSEKKKKMGKK